MRLRQAAAILVGFIAVGSVVVLVWAQFPQEPKIVGELSKILLKIEAETEWSFTAASDVVLSFTYVAVFLGTPTLVFLANFFLIVLATVINMLKNYPVAPPAIRQDPPNWGWILAPIGVWIVSIATVRMLG